jgi:hypothetical protein
MEGKNGAYEPVSLETLNSGQIVALFGRELEKILENIADDNTPTKAVRSMTITVKFRPEEGGESMVVEVSAKSSLAAVKPSKSYALLSFDGDKVTAYQNDPTQLKLGEGGAPAVDEVGRRKAAGAE